MIRFALIIPMLAAMFAACNPTHSNDATVSQADADPYIELRLRGIVVWGHSAYPDDRWEHEGVDLGPQITRLFMEAPELAVTPERTAAFGWTEPLPENAMPRMMQISVNPADSVFARFVMDDKFFVDKTQFANPKYRKQLIADMRVKQDERMAIELGVLATLERHKKTLEDLFVSFQVNVTRSLKDRVALLDSLEEVLSQLKADDLAGLGEIRFNEKNDMPRLAAFRKDLKTTDIVKVLTIPAEYLVSGNVDQVVTVLKEMREHEGEVGGVRGQ